MLMERTGVGADVAVTALINSSFDVEAAERNLSRDSAAPFTMDPSEVAAVAVESKQMLPLPPLNRFHVRMGADNKLQLFDLHKLKLAADGPASVPGDTDMLSSAWRVRVCVCVALCVLTSCGSVAGQLHSHHTAVFGARLQPRRSVCLPAYVHDRAGKGTRKINRNNAHTYTHTLTDSMTGHEARRAAVYAPAAVSPASRASGPPGSLSRHDRCGGAAPRHA